MKEIGLKSKMTSENKFKYSNILLKELLLEKPRNGLYKSIEYQGKGNRLIKMKTIFENDIISNQKMELIQVTKEEEEKFSCKTNDLVFSRTSIVFEGVGKCCIVDNISDKPIFESNTFMIRLDPSKSVPKFYFYYFNSPQGRNNIYGIIRQTAASQITSSDLMELSIPYPLFSIQQNVSSFLFSIDQRIINLKQQNFILEMIIQSIFKSWFIDFDGITEFEDSELGKIPKGWKVIDLKNSLSLLKDGSHNPPKRVESGIRFIAGATDVKHFTIDFSKCTFITQKDYEEIHKTWQIQSHDILLTIVGTIGNVAIVNQNDLPFSLQRSLAVLRPNEKIDFIFLYCLLNSNKFEQFLYSNLNTTGQPGIYLGTLGGFQFVLPPKPLIEKFFKLSQTIVSNIQKNYSNMDYLMKIRNSLLPKLMSGEIRV